MQAHDRRLPDWFSRIKSRQITLPRFQRFVAWDHKAVAGLITSVLSGLPSGVALILQVGEKEEFSSRTMKDAPETGERVTEQLLDGQQRLTALWRCLNDKFEDRTYFFRLEKNAETGVELPEIEGQARWVKDGQRFPLWADNPAECWKKKLIPVRLIRPDVVPDEADFWIDEAIKNVDGDKLVASRIPKRLISQFHQRIREFNLPYLALPSTTSREVALDVFIKMNTSAVKLTAYDIVVALVESETGESLHELVDSLKRACPQAATYADVPSLALDIAALRHDRVPSQASYYQIAKGRNLVADWPSIIAGVQGLVRILEEESIFDTQRLPSYTPLPVIAALWDSLPRQPDALGRARTIIRQYLWRSFLTTRYEQSSTSAALQDFRELKKLLSGDVGAKVAIFDERSYPLPQAEWIIQANWPKTRSTIGRGLLALQLRCGALDFADGQPATKAAIMNPANHREYHHLFPDSLLSDAGIPDEQIYRAVNCALITWLTNRTISNKNPIVYLKDRANNAELGDEGLEVRLRSHLIPFKELAVGYDEKNDPDWKKKVAEDYQRFCKKRAELLAVAAKLACTADGLHSSDRVFADLSLVN